MAIDYQAISETIHAMQKRLNDLHSLVRVGTEGKVVVDLIGDIEFTATQKQALVAKYNEVKAELVTLFGQLP